MAFKFKSEATRAAYVAKQRAAAEAHRAASRQRLAELAERDGPGSIFAELLAEALERDAAGVR